MTETRRSHQSLATLVNQSPPLRGFRFNAGLSLPRFTPPAPAAAVLIDAAAAVPTEPAAAPEGRVMNAHTVA